MRDLWCYFKSVFISTFKLIGKSSFSAFLLFLLHTFSMIDRAGITWHIADPFHKGTYLLPQLLSLAYFVSQKNFALKASMKVAKYCTPSPYFWGADRRTNIRPIILSVLSSGKGQISTSSAGNCRMSGACLFGPFGWKTECLQSEFHRSVETSEFCLHLFRGLQWQIQTVVSTCLMFSILFL